MVTLEDAKAIEEHFDSERRLVELFSLFTRPLSLIVTAGLNILGY
jgi:hypothetical protein